ncbi:MAG TPA: hypothetical protein VHS06_08070, partial [Chloroflexota bacterium]|nr:hypothetical protein [Chloroflexota bacterium]
MHVPHEFGVGLVSSGDHRAVERQGHALDHFETGELAKQAAVSQRAAARRLRVLLVGAVVFLLVAGILAVWALNQSSVAQANANEANTQRGVAQANFTHAEAQRLASEANTLILRNQNPETIALLALHSMNMEY